jgi:hypothetical protein
MNETKLVRRREGARVGREPVACREPTGRTENTESCIGWKNTAESRKHLTIHTTSVSYY